MADIKFAIDLGGTARTPEDVQSLYNLDLQFAEIPVTDPDEFLRLIESYKSLKETLELYYLCHGPREGDPNNIKRLNSEYLPQIFKILPIMSELDMPLLTLHLWLDTRFVKSEVIKFKIDLLKKIVARAEDAGITICLENLSENADQMAIPFGELPLLYLTLDLGHAQLLTEKNTSFDFIKKYPERIMHIHLHDNMGGNSPRDDLHLTPGKGIVDFKNIFKRLREIGYNRTVTVELKPHEIEESLHDIKALIL